MLKKLSYILLVAQTSLFGLMSGLFYSMFSGSTEGQGLAGGGILVFNAMFGLILGILIGVIAVVKIKPNSTSKANKIVSIINLVCIGAMVVVIISNS